MKDEHDDQLPARDDVDVGLWFRDRLQDALGFGAAALVVLGGWLISSDSIVSLEHPSDADHREAARLLLVFVPLLWIVWYGYLIRLRRRCPAHPTVIGSAWVHGIAWAVALGLAVLLAFVALD